LQLSLPAYNFCFLHFNMLLIIMRSLNVSAKKLRRIEYNSTWLRVLSVPIHAGLLDRPLVPRNLMAKSLEPCSFNKAPDFPQTYVSNILRVQRKGTQTIVCLSEAKALHRQTWTEVSSSAPHLLHTALSISPIMYRCLLRVLCPVRRSLTTLDCILSKYKRRYVTKMYVLGIGEAATVQIWTFYVCACNIA
jgi:hypothetical protein